MRTLPEQHEMQQACRRQDATYDGVFVLAVRTTGIFCRPSCPAKTPNPQNVEFYSSVDEALRAGYRPCKRCRPAEASGQVPEWVARLLARLQDAPRSRIRDQDLKAMSIDPARARRYFKTHFGMTFQAFSRARRMGLALGSIRKGEDLTTVALGNGYESNSGFRDAFAQTFGRSPGRSRETQCIVTRVLPSPLGPLLAAAMESACCLLEFSERDAFERQCQLLSGRFQRPIVPGNNAHLDKLAAELEDYFAGRLQRFTVPLLYPGTPFQVSVWDALRRIPYGRTISYKQLALQVGRPGAQRAVGVTNGKNPLAIVIPCHRVVNADGKLGGYGGGLWRKQFLLELEKA